ncbi:DNA mismatch endonuclease Vsr [Candidatus Parcubacteria bacterium]|nr:MAG: DNA mismatch endonuclease Vsr [Candidatus Parcubacteria bacterium]
MDRITPKTRSRNMSRIKSKNTTPELLVRRLLFKLGKRYRVHYELMGKPDIVFPNYKVVVFIHGCYWHGHGCRIDHVSKSNCEFWINKINKNKERDKKIQRQLKHDNWKLFTLWECDILKSHNNTVKSLVKYLNSL